MRYVLSCGGTAGHINPAIAIADKLVEADKEAEIFFVGSKGGMEQNLVLRAGYPIFALDVCGLKRKLTFSNIKALFKTLLAQKRARKLLDQLKPDAVIGTGGYVCYPVVKAASKMGIYTALHESNAVPGLAVRTLRKRVNKIFVSFDGCAERLNVGSRCVISGNPVSGGFSEMGRDEARKILGMQGRYAYLIVSFGGSLGARAVNDCALDIMRQFTCLRGDVLHIHSCGKNDAERFFERFKALGLDKCENIRVSEYVYDMPICLRAADVAVCRSGAMTLAELSCAGVCSVLIPSPNVTANHQYENAVAFEKNNAAFVINEKNDAELSKAVKFVSDLICDAELRKTTAKNALLLAKKDAKETIVNTVISETQQNRSR